MRNALKNPKTTVTDLFLHNRDYISIWKINFIEPMKEILTFFKLLHLKKDYTSSQLHNRQSTKKILPVNAGPI